MNIWATYTKTVQRNCTDINDAEQDLVYWRNSFFATTIIYTLPLCLIALIPGLYWIIKTEQYVIAAVDVITVLVLLAIAFVPGWKVGSRKVIFITCVYAFCIAILYYVGLYGPGLVYLLAACLFSLLIFTTSFLFWPAWLNLIICAAFVLLIEYDLLPESISAKHEVGEWIAVSANLVFLSFMIVAMIPRLFKSIQRTINNEVKWKRELEKEKQALDQALIQLNKKNEELDHFAFIASHDLQEPLRMISGFLTRINDKYHLQLDEKGQQYIHFAVNGARRMHHIINDLLEYSRAGKMTREKESIDLNILINEMRQLFASELAENNVHFTTGTLPVITSHRTLVEKVFQNLIGNAIKYRHAERPLQIDISVTDRISHWQFDCKDNGIGIDPKYYQKIFVVFQRLHGAQEFSGTGMGLTITRKIVEHLGGEIWVNSELNKGSTFSFSISK